MKLTSKKSKIITVIVAIVAVVLLLGAGVYYALSMSGYLDALKLGLQVQQQQNMSAENKIILAELKQIMLLPDNVTPNIAIINNIDVLKKSQPGFFGNAKNGDALIMYQDMAIIYDVQANKIIKIGPVQTSQPQPTAQPQQPAGQTQPQKTPSKP